MVIFSARVRFFRCLSTEKLTNPLVIWKLSRLDLRNRKNQMLLCSRTSRQGPVRFYATRRSDPAGQGRNVGWLYRLGWSCHPGSLWSGLADLIRSHIPVSIDRILCSFISINVYSIYSQWSGFIYLGSFFFTLLSVWSLECGIWTFHSRILNKRLQSWPRLNCE